MRLLAAVLRIAAVTHIAACFLHSEMHGNAFSVEVRATCARTVHDNRIDGCLRRSTVLGGAARGNGFASVKRCCVWLPSAHAQPYGHLPSSGDRRGAGSGSRLYAQKKFEEQRAFAFNRFVPVKSLANKRLDGARIVATEDELRGIAKRADLSTVNHLHANVTLTRIGRYTIKVVGNLTASVVPVSASKPIDLGTTFVVAALDRTVAPDVDHLAADNPYMFASNDAGQLNIGDICYSYFVLERSTL